MIDAAIISFLVTALIVGLITAPIWLRLVNEVTTRTIGVAVTICPHCGIPGVVESTNPKVIR